MSSPPSLMPGWRYGSSRRRSGPPSLRVSRRPMTSPPFALPYPAPMAAPSRSSIRAFPPRRRAPDASLWRNGAFRRVWAAATISIFGSLITRLALPLVAILTLNADAFGVALVRSMDLIAGLAVGLVAGAWVDRLRRRPVMIWADLGRAALLATIPLAAFGGWLSLPQLLLVALLDRGADDLLRRRRSSLPADDRARGRDLVRANGALAASSSVSRVRGIRRRPGSSSRS